MNSRSTSIFKGPNVAKHLSLLHDKYYIVSADRTPINIVFVCKSHYIDCLILDGIHKYFKVVFSGYRFRLTIFRPFDEHVSYLRSQVITWPVGLYK
jgi:hypothetical protein